MMPTETEIQHAISCCGTVGADMIRRLSKGYLYKHPMPVVTSDIIVYKVKYGESECTVSVLMIKRNKDPFINCWALPGGHFDVNKDASTEDCAIRELCEETKLNSTNIEFFGHYDKPGRDPRGRYIDFVYTTLYEEGSEIEAGDDAGEYMWQLILKTTWPDSGLHHAFHHQELIMAFDHNQIVQDWISSYMFNIHDNFVSHLAKEYKNGTI